MDKLEKYEAGKWVSPRPPVYTGYWRVEDWIRFIDIYGKWVD